MSQSLKKNNNKQIQKDSYLDLYIAQDLIYKPNGFICKNSFQEAEGKEYGASTFEMNNYIIKYRKAKITPTKIGQFITFWKRVGTGPIVPYDNSDQFDFLIASVRTSHYFGQFIFPKAVLKQQRIIAENNVEGKRAIRLYPPWDIPLSPQAKKTQKWQLLYFFDTSSLESFASDKLKSHFHNF